MNRWNKVLLVAVPLALVPTAALRYIDHTDREYSRWIETFDAGAALLDKRCADPRTPAACTAAGRHRALIAEYRDHRDSVVAWRQPVLAASLLAWAVVLVSAFRVVRGLFARSGR